MAKTTRKIGPRYPPQQDLNEYLRALGEDEFERCEDGLTRAQIDRNSRIRRRHRKAFSSSVRRSIAYLFQIAFGHQRAGDALALRLQAATKGKVLASDLRPDIWSKKS